MRTKHNGRFDDWTSEARGVPVWVKLCSWSVRVQDGEVFVDVA